MMPDVVGRLLAGALMFADNSLLIGKPRDRLSEKSPMRGSARLYLPWRNVRLRRQGQKRIVRDWARLTSSSNQWLAVDFVRSAISTSRPEALRLAVLCPISRVCLMTIFASLFR